MYKGFHLIGSLNFVLASGTINWEMHLGWSGAMSADGVGPVAFLGVL